MIVIIVSVQVLFHAVFVQAGPVIYLTFRWVGENLVGGCDEFEFLGIPALLDSQRFGQSKCHTPTPWIRLRKTNFIWVMSETQKPVGFLDIRLQTRTWHIYPVSLVGTRRLVFRVWGNTCLRLHNESVSYF